MTDSPHVQQMSIDAYTRLAATKLFPLRAADYLRAATRALLLLLDIQGGPAGS